MDILALSKVLEKRVMWKKIALTYRDLSTGGRP